MQFPFRVWFTAAAAGAMLIFSIAPASAQDARQRLSPDENRPRDESDQRAGVAAKGLGGAVAPNARLVALVDAGGRPVRTKGVAGISRINFGTYCIRPNASANINVTTIVPSVSVEYFFSNPSLLSGFNEMTVQWASSGSGCPSGSIGVYTFADLNLDGHYIVLERGRLLAGRAVAFRLPPGRQAPAGAGLLRGTLVRERMGPRSPLPPPAGSGGWAVFALAKARSRQ